jgi:hypothetical protein
LIRAISEVIAAFSEGQESAAEREKKVEREDEGEEQGGRNEAGEFA